jgi:hypothetical protein
MIPQDRKDQVADLISLALIVPEDRLRSAIGTVCDMVYEMGKEDAVFNQFKAELERLSHQQQKSVVSVLSRKWK